MGWLVSLTLLAMFIHNLRIDIRRARAERTHHA
jgi:hypothetical protein